VEKKNPQFFPCGSIKYNLTGLKRNATNVCKTLVHFLLRGNILINFTLTIADKTVPDRPFQV